MKNVVCVLIIVGTLFVLAYKINVPHDNNARDTELETFEAMKNSEWSRVMSLGELVLSGAVPAAPPFPASQTLARITRDGVTPYGAAYERLVRVASADELRAALNDAQPGDLIYLADGIYSGSFEASISGTAEARITLYGSRAAIIEGSSLNSGYGFRLMADYWLLAGFTVRNFSKGIVTDGASHNILRGLEVYQIGDEGVHFRSFSSNNILEQSWVHDVGLRQPEFGEAVYVGSAVSNWGNYSNGTADMSNGNQIIGNLLGPNIAAEAIDIKEGTTAGVVRRNIFITTDTLLVDSWVDVKGNGYEVSDNVGMYTAGSPFETAVQVSELLDGWGLNNNIYNNTEYSTDGTLRPPFRRAFDETGAVSILLPARPMPYSLSELAIRFPASIEQPDAATVLLKEDVIVGQGAHLMVAGDARIIRLLSTPQRYVSIVGYRSQMTVEGNRNQLIEFQSWDSNSNTPDVNIDDGRAYVLMIGGRWDVNYGSFADLGYYEGTVSGAAWKGYKRGDYQEFSLGNVSNSQFLRNFFGAYTYEAVEMNWRGNTFAHNISYGFDPHDFSNDFLVEENVAYANGSHGIIFSRGCDRNIIRNNDSFDNAGHGIMLDDGKVIPNSTNPRYLLPVPSNNNIIEGNRVWNNNDGIVLEGGSGNIVRNNQITGTHRYGIRLTDDVNDTLITNNTIEGMNEYGIFIYNNSQTNVVTDNQIVGGNGGVVIQDSPGNRVQNNSITRVVGAGIELLGNMTGAAIENNVVAGRGLSAINATQTSGVTLSVLLAENDVTGWRAPSPMTEHVRYGAVIMSMIIFLVPVVVKLTLGMGKASLYPFRLSGLLRNRKQGR